MEITLFSQSLNVLASCQVRLTGVEDTKSKYQQSWTKSRYFCIRVAQNGVEEIGWVVEEVLMQRIL